MGMYSEGESVQWNWGNGTGTGKVQQVYTRKITITVQGAEVTRNADQDNPAYRVKQDDGDEVLKSESELSKAT